MRNLLAVALLSMCGGRVFGQTVIGNAPNAPARTLTQCPATTWGSGMSVVWTGMSVVWALNCTPLVITPTSSGGAVALQATTPGTQQTGSANISGTAMSCAATVNSGSASDSVLLVQNTTTTGKSWIDIAAGNASSSNQAYVRFLAVSGFATQWVAGMQGTTDWKLSLAGVGDVFTANNSGNTTFGGTVTATSFLGTASAANALSANGTNCSAGNAAAGVDAAGNAEGCTALAANTTATTSNFFTAYNSSTGVFTKARPAFSDISGSVAAAQMPALTGDVTSSAGGVATTLATVNSNVGSFGGSTAIPAVTVNGKGLVTAVSTSAVVAPAGTLSGATLNSGVTASSLTSLGTLTGATINSGSASDSVLTMINTTATGKAWIDISAGTGSGSSNQAYVRFLGNAGFSTQWLAGMQGSTSWKLSLVGLGDVITATNAGNVSFSGTVAAPNLSGTNTGDQTSVSGNAGTATALQTARTINGMSFDGTANITITAAAGTLTGSSLAAGVTASLLTSFGSSPTLVTPTIADHTNATHNHTNAAGGGLLTFAAMTGNVDVSLTGQTASIGTTNLIASTPSAGIYRVSWDAVVTTAATTSSSLIVTVGWNNGGAKTSTVNWLNGAAPKAQADTSNTLNSEQSGSIVVNAANATAITYATTYASSGATAMAYSLRVKVERLSP